MSKAKFYIYRNLRTGGFSVRYKGRIIERLHTFSAYGVQFKVNELGRQRVIKEKQKNVHAFVVADKYKKKMYPIIHVNLVDKFSRITYNPYRDSSFMCDNKILHMAEEVAFQNGLCFVVK